MLRHNSTPGYLFPFVLLVATATPSFGCGDSGSGLNSNDAGPSTTDASTLPDASPDIDKDQDGYPVSQDCDDENDAIYPGVERGPCQSDCFHGVEVCLSTAQWMCTARTDCDCTTPGDTRIVDCQNCGWTTQSCGPQLVWSFPGDCHDQGDCAPGEVDEGPCDLCGTASRLCDQQCTWGAWDTQACFGDCAPGDQEITNTGCAEVWEYQLLECNASCEMETAVACTTDCLLPVRTGTTDFKNEICISAGDFVMGSDPGEGWDANEQPEHTVTLSAYYFDVYEVTVARYEECVNAGACTLPDAGSTYFDVGSGTLPVNNVNWSQANTYCAWDGGRRLPTEAEWEKAARGPAPREVSQPWGDTPPTCDLVPSYECPTTNGDIQPVDAFPLAVSYYGIFNMAGNLHEWCQDYYDANYYNVSSTIDPQGPSSGTERVIRGWAWGSSLTNFAWTVPRRGSWDGNFAPGSGFRCARSGNL